MQILEIHEVTQDDMGTYTCMVVNGSGKASMSAELSIPGMGWAWGDAGGHFPGVGTLIEEASPNRLCVYMWHTNVSMHLQGQSFQLDKKGMG